MDPLIAILDGVEFGPHSAKSLRNWLSGLKAASAVTFCRDGTTDEHDETEVNETQVFSPVSIAAAGSCDDVKWTGKLDKDTGLPKGQGLLSRTPDAAKTVADGGTLKM